MAIRPKTFTLTKDCYYGMPRKKGDVITGATLVRMLANHPELLTETKPPKTKEGGGNG